MEYCTQHQDTRQQLHDVIKKSEVLETKLQAMLIRMENIESSNKILHEMNVNISVLAKSHEAQCDKIDRIENDVRAMKEKPEKRMEGIIAAVITALIGGAIGYFISKL